MLRTYEQLRDEAVKVADSARNVSDYTRCAALARIAMVYAELARTASDRELRQLGQ